MDKLGPFELNKVHCIDALEALPLLPENCVDLVLTDPPYGVGIDYGNYVDDTEENWKQLMTALIPLCRRVAVASIMPSCRIKNMAWIYANIPPDWLICWYKGSPGTSAPIGFNDWEPHLVYGKPTRIMHDFFYATPEAHDNGHPCPKPMPWAMWLLSRGSSMEGIILDPFMGSGTTGVAAVQLGRQFLGFEINPEYCELANKRIEAARKGITVKELEYGQGTLF